MPSGAREDASTAPPDASGAPALTCVSIQNLSPYQAVGYGHMAKVQNNCERSVRCELWTDVDPQPRHLVELESKTKTLVAFRRDSPTRQFKVQASCVLR